MIKNPFFKNRGPITLKIIFNSCDLESTKKGKGATTVDGKMIDEVHYKQAKALLDIVK